MKPSWKTEARLEQAREHYDRCMLCEHRCAVNRTSGERGHCKAGPEARVFRHRVEYSEESELIPSHLFYLSGCDLRCAYCIGEANSFDPRRGRRLTSTFFNEAVAWGQTQGARNIQWLGGEPTIHLPALLEAMAHCRGLPPVIWKSDFYGTEEAFALLDGVADIYLADFKFGNDDCARRIAGVDNYVEVVTRNLRQASVQGDLIVRHLLLPGHSDCCYGPIVQWMKEEMPQAKFSVRDGYLPHWQAHRYSELAKPLEPAAGKQALEIAGRAGLNVIF